jgi:glycosyl hydrolase family 113
VAPATEADWRAWFASYREVIEPIAHIAAQEQADILVLGTELTKTVQRPEWNDLIASARMIFPGRLTYAAHNVEEADAVPFWDRLDLIGVTLYPPLGEDRDRQAHRAAMRQNADRLDALAARIGKPVLVAEIGIRSAVGAAAKPWESAEERDAKADAALQANVLADWLKILDQPSIAGVLIWRWFTDPLAGGPADTDFTVQGKPAEAALRCAWTGNCGG